jgi:hypothetical protein
VKGVEPPCFVSWLRQDVRAEGGAGLVVATNHSSHLESVQLLCVVPTGAGHATAGRQQASLGTPTGDSGASGSVPNCSHTCRGDRAGGRTRWHQSQSLAKRPASIGCKVKRPHQGRQREAEDWLASNRLLCASQTRKGAGARLHAAGWGRRRPHLHRHLIFACIMPAATAFFPPSSTCCICPCILGHCPD